MRTIDADALKKLVKEFRDDAPHAPTRKYVCNVVLSMLGDENQTPTIDAVPVVRCKDCKHSRVWENNPMTCAFWTDQWDMPTEPNAFCSFGEEPDHEPR